MDSALNKTTAYRPYSCEDKERPLITNLRRCFLVNIRHLGHNAHFITEWYAEYRMWVRISPGKKTQSCVRIESQGQTEYLTDETEERPDKIVYGR